MSLIAVPFRKARPPRALGANPTAAELRYVGGLLNALGLLHTDLSINRIIRDLAAGDLDAVVKGIDWAAFQAEVEQVEKVLVAVMHGRGEAALESATFGHAAAVGISFNMYDPRVIEFAHARGAEMAVALTDEAVQAIRSIITKAVSTGMPPRSAAVLIREVVGLHPRWQNAVGKYQARLAARGMKPSEVERLTVAYADKLRRRRALTIARSEIVIASNQGALAGWRQAKAQGLLHPQATVEWITGPDPEEEICGAMRGVERPFDGLFSLPDGRQVEAPPAHPNCRCSCALKSPPPAFTITKHPGKAGHDQKSHAGGRALSETEQELDAILDVTRAGRGMSKSMMDRRGELIDELRGGQARDYENMIGSIKETEPPPGVSKAATAQLVSTPDAAVRDKYVVNDAKTLANNAKLREGGKAGKWVKDLDAYTQTSEIAEDGVLYRGAAFDMDTVRRLSEGKSFTDAGFMSASPDRQTASFYAESRAFDNVMRSVQSTSVQHVMFEMRVKKGQRVGVMDSSEWVLPRGTTLTMIGFKHIGAGRWQAVVDVG